jgi:hypothetical protein
VTMSERERATVLAALRDRQNDLSGSQPDDPDIEDIATNSGAFRALTVAEIDVLCENLNRTQDD